MMLICDPIDGIKEIDNYGSYNYIHKGSGWTAYYIANYSYYYITTKINYELGSSNTLLN